MIELLTAAAAARPDGLALVSPYGEVTYRQLLRDAEVAAANLRARGARRVAVLEPDPAHVIAVLAGASRVGVEACVYPLAATQDVVEELRSRLEHELLITSREEYVDRVVRARDLLVPPADGAELGPMPEDRPHMVLTTGTTGASRGARHTWDRLLGPARRIRETPDQVWLLAYALNQFGGLQILIHVLAAHATLVVGASFQPRDALVAMRDGGVTHASGTPTFWRFLLSELKADGGAVPDLTQVTLSGEAVPAPLLERIRATFPHANVSQIYAATEFGQAITVRDGLSGLPASMLESGGEIELKIVDDELWVRSQAGMRGYHGEADLEPGSWRPTGDLVEVVGDRVEFRGRKTDVINVGGVKIHPVQVEERVSVVPGVAMARVFGRKNALTGAVVAVELVLERGHERESVEHAVREACADLPPAARPRSFRFADEMTTTDNKLTRRMT